MVDDIASDKDTQQNVTPEEAQNIEEQRRTEAELAYYIAKAREETDKTIEKINGPGVINPSRYKLEGNLDLEPALIRFIERCNIWEISEGKKEYICPGYDRGDGGLLTLSKAEMTDALGVFKVRYGTNFKYPYPTFREALKNMGRVLDSLEQQYNKERDKNEWYFDLTLNADRWVKPKVEYSREPHPLFDILIKCLSGGDHRIQEHLEVCILQKRFFYDDYTIPTIVWKDPGGTGKTLFVDALLRTIFNESVHIGKAEWIFGTKSNDHIVGKAIVLADDANFTQKEYEDAKRNISNRTIEVRKQRGNPRKVKNVGWFFISGNRSAPTVPVEGGDADRRFSIIELGYDHLQSKNLPYYIKQTLNLPNMDEAREYLVDNIHVLVNRDEVAIWLGELLLRRGMPKKKGYIHGFHEQSYIDQVKYNRKGLTRTLDLTLMTKRLTSFWVKDLFNLHFHYFEKRKPDMDPGQFGSEVKKYLKDYDLGRYWKDVKNGTMRYYRNDENGQRVPDTLPLASLEPHLSEGWGIQVRELYPELDKIWHERLPKQKMYPEKDTWTGEEIFNLLKVELGDEVVEAWDDDERENQIDSFLCRVRDDRAETMSEIWNDYNNEQSGASEANKVIIGETIEIAETHDQVVKYIFTPRYRDQGGRPELSIETWDTAYGYINEWIDKAETPEQKTGRQLLKIFIMLMRYTKLDLDDLRAMRWADLQKMHRSELVAKAWRRVNHKPEDGDMMLKIKVPRKGYGRIVFAPQQAVDDLYIWWRNECQNAKDYSPVFSTVHTNYKWLDCLPLFEEYRLAYGLT